MGGRGVLGAAEAPSDPPLSGMTSLCCHITTQHGTNWGECLGHLRLCSQRWERLRLCGCGCVDVAVRLRLCACAYAAVPVEEGSYGKDLGVSAWATWAPLLSQRWERASRAVRRLLGSFCSRVLTWCTHRGWGGVMLGGVHTTLR